MFLHGETGRRLRWCAVTLGVAIFGCAGLAPNAGAAGVRHYEKVSPADKGQGDIVGDGETTMAAKLGDAVAFSSRTRFGDEVGSGVSGQTQYVARRTSDGWLTHAVTPTSRPDSYQTFFSATKLQTYSEDLRTAVIWGYDLPGGGGTPARNNIYVEDVATRGLQALTLSQVDQLAPFDFLDTREWGVSADAQHVAFLTVNGTQLLPDATPGVPNIYQWDAGRGLSVAGILPDGRAPTGGSDVAPRDYRGAMSADGSRLVFTAVPNDDQSGDAELYMRIDGSMTVPISTPSGSSSFSTNVHLQAVTPDGRNVFFVTDSPLDPRNDRNSGPDIYRWTDSGDPAHDGTITEISTAGDVTSFEGTPTGVIGASDDGTRVYYETEGGRLAVWDNGTETTLSTSVPADPSANLSLAATGSLPGIGRVSPDGMWLAFLSARTEGNDGVHGLTGQVTNGHYEMYLYSLRDDQLSCVSCPSGTATSDASVVPDVTAGNPPMFLDAIRPQFLSENGQVFFSTAEALVPEDVNGIEDVYEYDPTATPQTGLRLLSTGTGRDPTSFADASASGGDVFIQTRQHLVSDDTDTLVDLYDVTTRPPLPVVEQAPAPGCQGDTCQPPPAASPPEDAFGSVSFDGAGNASPAGRLLALPRSASGRGAVASLRVRLFAAGRLTWHGRGVLAGSVRRGRGAFTVRVRLDRRARAQLRKQGRYVTRIRLTLVLADGTSASGIVRVTFRAEAKKGR